LVLRFYDPDEGAIELDGTDLRRFSLASLRRQIALVPQDAWIVDGTISDNIAFGRPDATPAQIEQAATVALVDEFVARLPRGYDTVVGESGALFSGGQRRRIALARAVLRDAPILLLDEPTSALDIGRQQQALELVEALRRDEQRTVISAIHDLTLAGQYADRLALLDKGQIVAEGSAEAVLTAPTIAAYYGADVRVINDDGGVFVLPNRERPS
jgi:ATP-binding cassette subfamily B protein